MYAQRVQCLGGDWDQLRLETFNCQSKSTHFILITEKKKKGLNAKRQALSGEPARILEDVGCFSASRSECGISRDPM